MSESNKLPAVDYRLKNLTNALYLTPDDDVALRTGISGDIVITGNVNIPGNVEIANDSGNPIPISKDKDPNSSTNRLYVSMETDAVVADSTYFMNVARGVVDSQYLEFKNAWTSRIPSGSEVTLWGQNTAYPWASWTTAQKLYVVSDNAADSGQTIKIDGLDSSYNSISETITTNGTTAVATTNNFLRINHMVTQTGNANVGTIVTHLGSAVGTIIGHMQIGWGRNRQSPYTVPAGWTAYVLYGDATQFRGGSGNIGGTVKMYTRTPNGSTAPWMVQFAAEVVNGYYRNDFTVPLRVPEKTDIDIRIIVDGNGTTASCNYQMILIPN